MDVREMIRQKYGGVEVEIIAPQEGPQTLFLSLTEVDIVIYGGAAGGGKSYALMLEPLRNVGDGRFRACTFRRTYPEISNPGGLWDISMEIYPHVGAVPRVSLCEWVFPSGARHTFAHMERENDKQKYLGAQFDLLQFDQLETFSASMFFFLVSRVRGSGATKEPRVRASVNPPDPNSGMGMWVRELLAPWVDPRFPKPAVACEVRYFLREEVDLKWLEEKAEGAMSITFVPATIFDNKILLQRDPGQLSRLNQLPYEDRQRLRDGRWEIVRVGLMFHSEWFYDNIVRSLPANMRMIRVWDKAATADSLSEKSTAYSEGLKVGYSNGHYYLISEVHERLDGEALLKRMRQIALLDTYRVKQYEEKEPGASGKIVSELNQRTTFSGFDYEMLNPGKAGDKITRAKPAAAAAEAGLVHIYASGDPAVDRWIAPFIEEVCMFPNGLKDRADALAWAVLILGGTYSKANIETVPMDDYMSGRRAYSADYRSNKRSNSLERFEESTRRVLKFDEWRNKKAR
jgi:predicted phage terminase large subunit-like protein